MLRRDTTKFLHGGKLCVSTYASLKWMKAEGFSKSSEGAKIVLKSAGHKWYWPPNKAIKCRPLRNWFITLNIMSVQLLRNLTKKALRRWNQNRVPAGRQSLPKMKRLLSPRQPNARRIFWAVRLNAGRWRNCGSILSRKRLSPRSVLRHFEQLFMRKKSGSDVPKRGKNATIRGSSLKKTNPQICKPARSQWPNGIFRRVRPSGDTSSTRTNLLPHGPSETTSCNIYPPPRCSALAGVLRCAPEKTVGLCSSTQKTSGVLGNVEVFEKEVSGKSANPFDIGQLLAAPQAEGVEVLPTEQHSYDMDTDQCFMAESYRMPVYPCEGICDSWNQLSKS